jgi:hypothetical protein
MLTWLHPRRGTSGKLPLLILALAAGNACLAAEGRMLDAPPASSRSASQLGWTVADFDGDSRPDVAISRMESRSGGYFYWLEFDLSTDRKDSSGPQTNLPNSVSSLFGLHLTPRDVDGDHDLDIVVTIGITRRPVAVWINNGKGRFEEGNLGSYPALTSLENLALSTPGWPDSKQIIYDQGSRSQSLPLPARGILQPLLRTCLQAASQAPVSAPSFVLERAPARAPPSSL